MQGAHTARHRSHSPGFRGLVRDHPEALVVGAVLIVALIVRLPNLDHPLLEANSFRQTQTAYTALVFHQQGINLFAPQLPVLGAPWQVPFEFPLFQALAAVLMNMGMSPDVALRAVGIASFMGCAVAVWGLVRHLSNRTAALLALIVFLAWPFDIFYSRTSLIDYLASAFAVGWAWAGLVWIDRHQARVAVLAIFLGVLGMLVKPTSAIFWMLPFLLYRTGRDGRGWVMWLRQRMVATAVLVVIPLAAGVAWTLHADHIKAASDSTSWLTSGALARWNLGTPAQRLAFSNWKLIAHRIDTTITGMPWWALALVFVAGALRRRRAVWIGVALATVLPVVVFFNLYAVHEYYLIAITPGLAAVVGYALEGGIGLLRSKGARAIGYATVGVWLCVTLFTARSYLATSYHGAADPLTVLPASREVDAGTTSADLVVFEGLDWSSAIPYYSRRTGMMLPTAIITPHFLDSLPGQGYDSLYAAESGGGTFSDTTRQVLRRWRWFSVMSPHLFQLGDSYASVARSGLAASTDPSATLGGAASLLTAPRSLQCGSGDMAVRVVSGAPVTLAFQWMGSPTAVSITGLWLPPEALVVVDSPQLEAGGVVNIGCSGVGSVVLQGMFSTTP